MNILISAYTGLGNSILLSPLIHELRNLYGDNCLIYLAGDDKYGALTILNGLQGVTVIYPDKNPLPKIDLAIFPKFGSEKSLEQKIRKSKIPIIKHYDHHLLNPSHPKFRTRSALKILFEILRSQRTTYVPIIPCRHEAELNLDLLRQYTSKPIPSCETSIGVFPELNHLKKWNLTAGKYCVFQPSVANGKYSCKAWNPENFVKLASRLKQKIILIGDVGDKTSLENVKWPSEVMNLMGETTLHEVVSLIKFASVNLVHDSGAMHIGVAIKAKVIALLGPTDFHRTGPFSDSVKCLYSNNESLAEMHNFRKSEWEVSESYSMYNPMSALTVDEVEKALT